MPEAMLGKENFAVGCSVSEGGNAVVAHDKPDDAQGGSDFAGAGDASDDNRNTNNSEIEQAEYTETEQADMQGASELKAKEVHNNHSTTSTKLNQEHGDHNLAEGYEARYDGDEQAADEPKAEEVHNNHSTINTQLNDMLTKVCLKIFEDNKLTNGTERENSLKDIERHLKEHLDPNARLKLFGSSVNNFGFQGSDMDICMRYQSDQLPDGLDHAAEVEKISKALEKSENIQDVVCIRSAKVPIVKFIIRDTYLNGDISFYNCLAWKNSTMLKDYSNIDKRVRVLGYCIKFFAKLCGIGDASRGSLSSYAYILLMLYYLQRCEPPVIPVLQELYDHTKEKPISMIEGWDTWYYDDIKNLSNVWDGYNKNKQTVGELWLGFFVFYADTFDFNKNVVSMRQVNPLSKSVKNWGHSTMAIEDPFDLKHNLGAGIHRDMFKYLLGLFRKARSHFGTLDPKLMDKSGEHETEKFLMDYFFDREKFTDNQPAPTDGLCGRCGKIGHSALNCDHVQDLTDVECYGCKKKGHYFANCPENLKNDSQSLSHNDQSQVQQASSEFDSPDYNLVLARSEMTLRDGGSRQRLMEKGKNVRKKSTNAVNQSSN